MSSCPSQYGFWMNKNEYIYIYIVPDLVCNFVGQQIYAIVHATGKGRGGCPYGGTFPLCI